MVSILVDEGYAYDYLAILIVKNSFPLSDFISGYIAGQVGGKKHNDIITSEEFKNLIQVNRETFIAVEKARYGEISAKEVDNANMKRYNSKVELQNKFFPESKVTEVKT
jgi:hypothetical protein